MLACPEGFPVIHENSRKSFSEEASRLYYHIVNEITDQISFLL